MIEPAEPQLIALAAAMRPEWDCDVLAAAILAAKNAGWSWARTFTETARMLTDEHASPWDLKRAAANPLRREAGVPPTAAFREARARMAASS